MFNKPGSETQEEVGLDTELGSLKAVVDVVTKLFKCHSRNGLLQPQKLIASITHDPK